MNLFSGRGASPMLIAAQEEAFADALYLIHICGYSLDVLLKC